MTVSCTMLLIWVRHLPEDALLLMIRQAFGLEAREGETDVLASFHEVATSVPRVNIFGKNPYENAYFTIRRSAMSASASARPGEFQNST